MGTTATSTTDTTITFIDHNPMLKKPVFALLSLCGDGAVHTRGEIEAAAAPLWSEQYCQSAATCIDILVRKGALIETLTVDGQPYAGKIEDMQLDETVPDDAEIVDTVQVTRFGHRLQQDYAPEATLAAAFARHPEYAHIYDAVLQRCAAAPATRTELEELIDTFPELAVDPDTHKKKVYPQFFLDELEKAGGIEWQDGAWQAAAAGAAYVAP